MTLSLASVLLGALAGAGYALAIYAKKALAAGPSPVFDLRKFGLPVLVGAITGAYQGTTGADLASVDGAVSTAATSGLLAALVQGIGRGGEALKARVMQK